MLSTTPPTTNWSEPRPWSKVASSPSILPHSDNGTNLTTPRLLAARRTPNCPKKKKLSSTVSQLKSYFRKKTPSNVRYLYFHSGPKSAAVQKKLDARRKEAEVAAALVEQFSQGRLLARIASRPGQTGRCDGYILEGKELDFYVRKLKAKKSK